MTTALDRPAERRTARIPKCDITEVEITDDAGVILSIRWYTPCGLQCNPWGSVFKIQNLDDWSNYLSNVKTYWGLQQAWRLLLTGNQGMSDFSAIEENTEEFEAARQMLIDRDAKLEMQYKEK